MYNTQCLHEYIRYLPAPKVIHCDDEGVFSSDEFKEWCNQRSIHIRPCAGEAHWQNGIVERHIGTLKQIVQRLFLDDLYAELEPEYILYKACGSKNVNGSYGGYAPIQWLHGTKKHPLIDSEEAPPSLQAGTEFEEHVMRRAVAAQAFHEAEAKTMLRLVLLCLLYTSPSPRDS